MRKVLGKISSIDLSCKDGKLGLFIYFDLDGGKSGIADQTNFIWSFSSVTPDSHHKWTEEDRVAQAADIMKNIDSLLYEAKKEDLQQLRNIPVEVTIKDSNCFDSFRILTEVL